MVLAEYRLKPNIPKADFKRLMDEFAKRAAGEELIAHYVRADATGGFTIEEADDITEAYEDALVYSEFLTFTITPILKIDDAVGAILAYLG